MKRVERHHLKENEIEAFVRQTREAFDTRRREVTGAAIALAVVGVVALGYFAWHQRVQAHAHALLADALVIQDARIVPPPPPGGTSTTPTAGTFPTERARAEAALPKLKAVADAYPSTDAGLFARYQEAATLLALGRPAEAVIRYDEVVKHDSDGIYGQMARLGAAEAHARAGQYDQAINGFKDLAQRKDGPLPIDGVLMQLGRTYLDAGKPSDAQQTFNRLVQEYPDSPFTGDAKRELDNLKKT